MTFNQGDFVQVSGYKSDYVRDGDVGIVIGWLGGSIQVKWFNPIMFHPNGSTTWYAPDKCLTKIGDSEAML